MHRPLDFGEFGAGCIGVTGRRLTWSASADDLMIGRRTTGVNSLLVKETLNECSSKNWKSI
ncbi:hypothetical protein [Bremerella cremea]|uniref:hypothetical protein n=1 Tax=Bremerella cremea TaxID=1031537 RepID=UPI0011C017D9|nr:hypothetical protein [Bremerella cremea]